MFFLVFRIQHNFFSSPNQRKERKKWIFIFHKYHEFVTFCQVISSSAYILFLKSKMNNFIPRYANIYNRELCQIIFFSCRNVGIQMLKVTWPDFIYNGPDHLVFDVKSIYHGYLFKLNIRSLYLVNYHDPYQYLTINHKALLAHLSAESLKNHTS